MRKSMSNRDAFMKNTIHNPHDKLLFKSLKDLRVARDFIKAYLPKELLKDADLDSIKLYNSKMISSQYKKFEADIIYEIKIKGKPILLLFHCEHQSTPDENSPLRIWQYLLLLLQEYKTNHPKEHLPLVYPFILYTGEKPYTYSTYLFDLFGPQKALAEKYLLNPIPIVDVCRIPDEEMQKRLWFGLVQYAFKHRQTKEFGQFLEHLFSWI